MITAASTLTGAQLGCTQSYPQSSWPVPVGTLLQWDLMVRISENYPTVGGPATLSHADILGNSGCGSSKIIGSGFSIYAFNLEVYSANPQIVFAQQVYSLFYDLYDALAFTACSVVPQDGNNGQRPLSATACTTLYNYWESARDKLDMLYRRQCTEAERGDSKLPIGQQSAGQFRDCADGGACMRHGPAVY